MVELLSEFADPDKNMTANTEILYSFEYNFERENGLYGDASNKITVLMNQTDPADIKLASTLANQISCQTSNLTAIFPTEFVITLKTNQD